MSDPKSIALNHVTKDEEGRMFVCNFCQHKIPVKNISRVIDHLAGRRGDGRPCKSVDPEVQASLRYPLPAPVIPRRILRRTQPDPVKKQPSVDLKGDDMLQKEPRILGLHSVEGSETRDNLDEKGGLDLLVDNQVTETTAISDDVTQPASAEGLSIPHDSDNLSEECHNKAEEVERAASGTNDGHPSSDQETGEIDEKQETESPKTSVIEEKDQLLQELDDTKNKLEQLSKKHLELKQQLNQSLIGQSDAEKLLQQAKLMSDMDEVDRLELLLECELLQHRLRECSRNLLNESEDKLVIDSPSLHDALKLVKISDYPVEALLAQVEDITEKDSMGGAPIANSDTDLELSTIKEAYSAQRRQIADLEVELAAANQKLEEQRDAYHKLRDAYHKLQKFMERIRNGLPRVIAQLVNQLP